MLSRTSASPDVAFTCPPGTHSTAVKQNSERGSLCLDCPYAGSHPALSTQLRVHVLEKGFPELADIIAPSAAPAPLHSAPHLSWHCSCPLERGDSHSLQWFFLDLEPPEG